MLNTYNHEHKTGQLIFSKVAKNDDIGTSHTTSQGLAVKTWHQPVHIHAHSRGVLPFTCVVSLTSS
jgi:hypothetical protein